MQLVHAADVINYLPEAGHATPVQNAGGKQVDVYSTYHLFGCRVVYYEHEESRRSKSDKTTGEGIYVGRSLETPGAVLVAPIDWIKAKGMYEIGKVLRRKTVKVYDSEFPLTNSTASIESGKKFEQYVLFLSLLFLS